MDSRVFIVHSIEGKSEFTKNLDKYIDREPGEPITIQGRFSTDQDSVSLSQVQQEIVMKDVTSVTAHSDPGGFYVEGRGPGGYMSGTLNRFSGEGQIIISSQPPNPIAR